ncbi:MAG: glycosyltransferase family 39 protein [Sedimentisphaerales bacterium]|jgi:hypothetical protein
MNYELHQNHQTDEHSSKGFGAVPKNNEQFIAWINLRLLSVVFLLFVALVGWSNYYNVNPDGLSYIGIARLLKLHAWYDSISGERGPLISWLLAPLSVHLPELFAVRIITTASSVAAVLVSWCIVRYVLRDDILRRVAIVTIMFMPLLSDTTALITPDLMFSVFVMLAFFYGMKFLEKPGYKSAVLIGLSWALAYFAKSFGFVFAWLFFMLLWLLAVFPFEWRRLIAVSKPLILGMVVFIIVSLPWLSALRYKYGCWMSGSVGKVNLFYEGPYAQLPTPPPKEDAMWLNPQTFSMDNRMAGHYDCCPPGDVIYTYSVLDIKPGLQVKKFFANLMVSGRFPWKMFRLACIPIIIGFVLCLSAIKTDKRLLLIMLGSLFWVALYLIVCMRMEKRFLMPIVPLLVVVAAKGYESARLRLSQSPIAGDAKGKFSLINALLLFQVISILLMGGYHSIRCIRDWRRESLTHAQLAQELVQTEGVTNLSQTSSCWYAGRNLAVIADIRYLGQIVPDQHPDGIADVLRKGHISHLVTLPAELDKSRLEGLGFVREFKLGSVKYWLYKVFYDE